MQDKVVLRRKLMRQATSKIVVVPPEVLALWHIDSGHIYLVIEDGTVTMRPQV